MANKATVAHNIAWYLFLIGEYTVAEEASRSTMIARDKVLGPDHPYTLVSVSQLRLVLERQ